MRGKYDDWLTDDGLTVIRGWARDGLSNKQIAERMGVRAETLSVWIGKYSQLSKAIKKGREPVAVKVEDAFYSKCEWQEYEETREEILKNENGKETKRIVRIRHKIPPDTTALIFALKNLRSDKWRDKPIYTAVDAETKHSALIDAIKEMSDDD